MKVFEKISVWGSDLGRVFRNEFRLIFRDAGVMLFFIALPLFYPVIYTLIYNPEVVREIPVAVVDNSRTAESRSLVQKASATPTIALYAYANDMAEARELVNEGKVFGIIEIPGDYAKNIGNGVPAHVQFYCEMSLLLRYRQFVGALTDLQLDIINELTGEKVSAAGLASLATGNGALPVRSDSHFLGDTEQGFASFIIPGILILILQQSMLLGIGMIHGTSRERRMRNGGIDPLMVNDAGPLATIWGKALAYVVFYIPLTLYALRVVPEMFNLPHYGSPADYLLFIVPMMLATAFLGLTMTVIMKERESPFLIIVFTSVVFLFLSGLTWPRYAMNHFFTWMGDAIPAVWGVEGFVQINSNAASLPEVARDFIALWILTGIYMVTSYFIIKYSFSLSSPSKSWRASKD